MPKAQTIQKGLYARKNSSAQRLLGFEASHLEEGVVDAARLRAGVFVAGVVVAAPLALRGVVALRVDTVVVGVVEGQEVEVVSEGAVVVIAR
jgi:hypothetical protein